MPVILTNQMTRRCVAPGEISKILTDAAARQANLTIRVHAKTPPPEMPGCLVACDESAMVARLSGDTTSCPFTATSLFSVVLWVDGVQYTFETTNAGGHRSCDDEQVEAHVLRLTIPSRIDIMERRRASRRLLQEPSWVHLRPTDDSAGDHSYPAVMMNVSPHGLACRLDTSQAEGLSVGVNLMTTFSIEPSDPPFVFPARIVSITSGGTPGQAVVGIELIDDGSSHAQEEALVAALARDSDA